MWLLIAFPPDTYSEFRRWILSRFSFFFELCHILSKDLSIFKKVIQMPFGFLSTDHDLNFISKPILEEKLVMCELGDEDSMG